MGLAFTVDVRSRRKLVAQLLLHDSQFAGASHRPPVRSSVRGVLFGASILGPSGRHSWLARSMLKANNRRGTFGNLDDTKDGLRQILEASFERVELETVGSMAIFAATNPRTKPW